MQERQPERALLTRPHVDAEHFALALAVDPGGHHDAHVDGPPVLADLLSQRIQPQAGIRPAVQRPAEERLDDDELLADARDLALRDALAAEGLHQVHQILDAAGRGALYVGLLHDGKQRPFAAPPRFKERGK